MVDEPRDVSLARRVNEVLGGEGHEVKMLHVIARIFSSSFPKLSRIQNLANILHQEGITVKIKSRFQLRHTISI